MSESLRTINHGEIRKWAEERNGMPAKIKTTGKNDADGILRIHFPEKSQDDDKFEEISWDDFFKNFDNNKLDFLYQDKKAGGEQSTFHKFVARD